MNCYNVVQVLPPKHRHAAALAEVATLVHEALLSRGIRCTRRTNIFDPNSVNIVIGYHLLSSPDVLGEHQSIVFQLEHLSRTEGPWSARTAALLAKAVGIWDYSPSNLSFLAAHGFTNTTMVALGYHPALSVIEDRVPDVDVLFYGSSSPRRSAILSDLARLCRVEHLTGVYGPARDEWIARSKIVLNVYHYADPCFDEVRISFLLNNGRFVVSEDNRRNPYPGGIVTAKYEHLVDVCMRYLRAPEERARIASLGAAMHRAQPMAEMFGAVLAETEAWLRSPRVSRSALASSAVPARPRVSLCVIARNEEKFLERCLLSAAHLVDEIVLVDSGSEDMTRAIAESFGARVLLHEWNDDFAAARNVAAAAATGDWLLVLDADERLAAPRGLDLASTLASVTVDAVLLPLLNADALDEEPDVAVARAPDPLMVLRLVRQSPTLRWEGRIHENVGAWLGDRPVACLSIPIVHYGGLGAVRAERKKSARNTRLLSMRITEAPGDVSARIMLAEEYWLARRLPEAFREIDLAWEHLSVSPQSASPDFWVRAGTVRTLRLLAAGDPAGAMAAAIEASRHGGVEEHSNLSFVRGLALEALAQAEMTIDRAQEHLLGAQRAFELTLSRRGALMTVPPIAGATSWHGRVRVGIVLLQLGAPGPALEQFDLALGQNPNDLGASLARVEALLELGNLDAAGEALDPHMSPAGADAMILGAEYCLRSGATDDGHRLLDCLPRTHSELLLLETHRWRRLESLRTQFSPPHPTG